ncbi:MAG: hypothetical protein WC082_01495 [Victivallales bacterium]
MNPEIFHNELFAKIKNFISKDKGILDESIGESDYAEILSLTEKDLPDLRKLARLWLEFSGNEEDRIRWNVAITAWRAAAAVNITEAVRLMLELLDNAEKLKIESDLLMTDLEQAGKMADKAAIVFLCDFIQIKTYGDYTTISAVDCLACAAKNNHDMENIVKDAMAKRFMDYENNSSSLNAFLIDGLTDLEAVELAETMERAFAAGKVDESHVGIWEDIRYKLGVPGMGLVPDGVRVTPDPFKELKEKLRKLTAQTMVQNRQLQEKIKKNKRKEKKVLKKIRKMKRKGKR